MNDHPFTETVELDNGGILIITRFSDGEHRFAYEHTGVRFSFGLTPTDLASLEESLVAVLVAGLTAGLK